MSTPLTPQTDATITAEDDLAAAPPPAAASVHIDRVEALSYRGPASESATGGTRTNVVITLTGHGADGEQVTGIGEGQPRESRTGDDAGDAWLFLEDAASRLQHRELPTTSREAALEAVRQLTAELAEVAVEHADGPEHKHPFRGSLLGLEIALLDLVATALGLPMSQLLGQVRDRAPRTPTSLSDRRGVAHLQKALAKQADTYPLVRLVSSGDPVKDLGLLELAATLDRHPDIDRADKPLWMDLNGALTREQADSFVEQVASAAAQGRLPRQVVIEQPVPVRYGDHLADLQRLADAVAPQADVRIMGDESVWDAASLLRLRRRGGLRAIQIRPAQAGGLLASLDLARAALAEHPDTLIFLSRMVGASQLTGVALRSLALALPAIESAAVDASVDDQLPITKAAGVKRRSRTGRIKALQTPGLGVAVSYTALVSDIGRLARFPAPPPPRSSDGREPTVYHDVDDLHPLGPNGSKGHLLEREALALGLSTTRFSKGAFTATDGRHEPLNFRWSRGPLSSAVSLALCTHKEGTRMQLQRAGVPVPQGRTFAHGDYDTARQFVQRIGFPVVVKPTMGVRGIGVVANIRNRKDLDAAFRQMSSSKLGGSDFIVEKHVNGADYRIVVVGDQVLAAILREPASVTGDGQSTIAELLIAKNNARRRNPHLWARPIKYDDAAKYELKKAGLKLRSVPEAGQRVRLNSTCSLSQGGDSIDVLDEMHPSILEACVKAVKAVPGMAYCGVDFLLEDHTKPLSEQDAGICELNAHAAIGNCEYPLFGTPRPVARTFMKACVDHFDLDTFPEPAPEVALHLTIRGRVTKVGYRRWLQRRARQSGVTGWVRNVGKKTVEAVLVGPTAPTTAVAAATILGPKNAIPTSYTARHVPRPEVSDFVIEPDVPAADQPTQPTPATDGENHAA